MDELTIDVKVVANLAVTTMTMNFHNDLDRVREGRLNFLLEKDRPFPALP